MPAHLEPGHLALGPEAVLPADQDPEAGAGVPVEGAHHVDGVLKRARACHVAVLRHLPGQDHRGPIGFRHPDQRVGAGTNLARSPRQRRLLGIADGLDRVHEEDVGLNRASGFEEGGQLPPAQERGCLGRDADPAGPPGDLPAGLLPGGVQAGPAVPRESGGELQEERRFPHAGLPGHQHHGPPDEPPTEDPIDAGQPGGQAIVGVIGEAQRLDRGCGDGRRGSRRRSLQRSPRPARRTASHPLSGAVPAGAACEHGPLPGHDATVARPSDMGLRAYVSREASNEAPRWAMASIVTMGFTPLAVGKHDASITKRPRTPCTWFSSFTTDRRGAEPIRAEPIWWKETYIVRLGPYPTPSTRSRKSVSGSPVRAPQDSGIDVEARISTAPAAARTSAARRTPRRTCAASYDEGRYRQ